MVEQDKVRHSLAKNNRITIFSIIVLLILIVGFGMLAFSMATNRIIDISVQNLEELAQHDEQAIESNLHRKWRALEKIGRYIRQNKNGTGKDVMDDLSDGRKFMECICLTLVSDRGNTLSSDMTVARDDDMLRVCRKYEGPFICRMDGPGAASEGGGEEILVGAAVGPVTVEGDTYSYLVARLDTGTFERELKMDSYNGRGYSCVIDREGNYIVNADNSLTAQEAGNFYHEVMAGTLEDGYTLDMIRQRIGNQEHFTVEYIREDGTECIMAFIPVIDRDWSFIMTVPKEVFEEQSLSLMKIFMFLVASVFAASVITVVTIVRRRSRVFAMEKKYREELADALVLAEQANRAKTTFLNNMSHDIRTPMNAIIGFTALASAHIGNRERVADYLAKISQSSNHLLSLINDVLDMSRIESGKVQIEEKPENMAEILHGLRNIVQADIHSRQLEFFIDTVDVSDEDIYCDKLRLNQVLLNILSNAMKYTHPGGTVSVRITQKAVSRPGYGMYEFRIKDTGIGMSREFVNTIFEPFTREHNSTVSGIQGTGLGMSITKNIVDMMGGTIEVVSEEGRGSEFIVTMEFKLREGHKEIEVIRSLEGLRGLVVDDDMNTCQSISQMLRQIGMRPEWTMYGKEAVARTQEALKIGDRFHVYILDWLMPDINGIETARRIRSMVGKDAPIILLSAYDWADIEEEAREAGVTDFISKPLFPSNLRRILMKVCGEPADKKEEEEKAEIDFQGKRLLLVEDNALNREIATEILQDVGFVVETAENGQEAVDIVSASEPGYFELVLMDVQMPVMDGYEATRAIRGLNDPDLAHIPVIAMTANAFEEDKQAAYSAGMDAHVGKPIDIPVLMEALRQIVNRQR